MFRIFTKLGANKYIRSMIIFKVVLTHNPKYFTKLKMSFKSFLNFVLLSKIELDYFIKRDVLIQFILFEVKFIEKLFNSDLHIVLSDDFCDQLIILLFIQYFFDDNMKDV